MHLLLRHRHPRTLNKLGSCRLNGQRTMHLALQFRHNKESTTKPPAKRRKLDPDNRTLPANSTGSILSKPAKEPRPILIREREVAHAIYKNGKLREPGPCYECLHRRKSKGLEFPKCKVAVDGRKRRCAWCTHQQQRCTQEVPLSWTKKWSHQGKDNGKSQEEHVHSNGGKGKAANSQMTSYPVEDGSVPAQTEICLGFKVRCELPRLRLYKGAAIEVNS